MYNLCKIHKGEDVVVESEWRERPKKVKLRSCSTLSYPYCVLRCICVGGGGRYANSALALDTLVKGEGEASLCRQNPSVGL